jgi:hypothetical protein
MLEKFSSTNHPIFPSPNCAKLTTLLQMDVDRLQNIEAPERIGVLCGFRV